MEHVIKRDYKLDSSNSEMEQYIYRLRIQVEDLEEIIAENKVKINMLNEEYTQLTNNIEDLNIERLELQSQNNNLKEINKELQEEESKYKETISYLQVTQQELEETIEESNDQVKLLEQKNIDLDRENRRLKNELLINKDSVEKLELEGTGLKSIIEIERIKHSNIEKQIEAIESILESTR